MSGIVVKHVTAHKTGQWWVVNTSPAATADTITQYTVVEGTQADADNLPNGGGVSGPYTSLGAANKVAAAEPQNKNVSVFPGVNVTPGGQVSGPLSGLEAIGAFFSKIGSRAFMVRAVKVVLGAGLIVVGVVQLSGAGGVAKKIASDIKVVPV